MRSWKTPDENPRHRDDSTHFGLRAHILQKTLVGLGEEGVDGLTIGRICAAAEVSRSTFYRLFTDKHDVFKWYLRVTMRSSIAQIGDVLPWDQGLLSLCRALDKNRRLAVAFLAESSSDESRDACRAYAERAIARTVRMRFPGEAGIPPRYQFEIRMFAVVLSVALVEWLQEDTPPYLLADRLLTVVPHDLIEMLNVDVEGEPFTNERIRATDDSAVIELVAEEVFTSF